MSTFSNNVVAVARSDFSVATMVVQESGSFRDIRIIENIMHKTDDVITSLFLDNSGSQLFLLTSRGDTIYLNLPTSKQLRFTKFHGTAESVAFGREVEGEADNRSFLVGTSTGKTALKFSSVMVCIIFLCRMYL